MSKATVNVKKVLDDRWNGKTKTLPVVEVFWHDATSVSGDEWMTSEDALVSEPAQTISVGYLWVDKPTHVTLVSVVNSHHLGYGLTIPRGMIDSIKVLG